MEQHYLLLNFIHNNNWASKGIDITQLNRQWSVRKGHLKKINEQAPPFWIWPAETHQRLHFRFGCAQHVRANYWLMRHEVCVLFRFSLGGIPQYCTLLFPRGMILFALEFHRYKYSINYVTTNIIIFCCLLYHCFMYEIFQAQN